MYPSAVKIVPVRMADGELHSLGGGAEASLVLLNNSARGYSIQWLNFKGQLIDYGTLEPMSYRVMQTYVRHAWALKNTASGRINQFVVDAPAARWRVDN